MRDFRRMNMRHAARFLLATAAATAFAGVAHADDTAAAWGQAGSFQVKLLATAVLPAGHVSSIPNDTAKLVSGGLVTGTSANNNYVPTIAAEYFVTKNISIETIAGVTAHHVSATSGALAGNRLVTNIQIVPATFTAKYHFTGIIPGVVPYIGAGPSVFLILADRPSDFVLANTAITRTKLTTEPNVAVQAGFDAPITRNISFTFDAKKYFNKTTAHFWAGSTQVEAVRVNLIPWVISTGVAYRF